MVVGIAISLARDQSLLQAVHYGVAAGAAAVRRREPSFAGGKTRTACTRVSPARRVRLEDPDQEAGVGLTGIIGRENQSR